MTNQLHTPEAKAKAAATRAAKKAAGPTPSLRKCINEKCKDCVYDTCDVGTWRQQVTACTCTDCPLYLVRPMAATPLKSNSSAISVD